MPVLKVNDWGQRPKGSNPSLDKDFQYVIKGVNNLITWNK